MLRRICTTRAARPGRDSRRRPECRDEGITRRHAPDGQPPCRPSAGPAVARCCRPSDAKALVSRSGAPTPGSRPAGPRRIRPCAGASLPSSASSPDRAGASGTRSWVLPSDPSLGMGSNLPRLRELDFGWAGRGSGGGPAVARPAIPPGGRVPTCRASPIHRPRVGFGLPVLPTCRPAAKTADALGIAIPTSVRTRPNVAIRRDHRRGPAGRVRESTGLRSSYAASPFGCMPVKRHPADV